MRFLHLMSWVMVLGAVALACEGIILLTAPSGGLAQGVLSLIDSGVLLLGGVLGRRGWRQYRHNLIKALQLHRDDFAPHS